MCHARNYGIAEIHRLFLQYTESLRLQPSPMKDRIELLESYLAQAPHDSFLRHALALEHIKRGDNKTAITLFHALLHDDPDYVGSYYHLGKALERSGQENQAQEVYAQGMKVAKKLNDQHAFAELREAGDALS